jgi:hypothetical protein
MVHHPSDLNREAYSSAPMKKKKACLDLKQLLFSVMSVYDLTPV